MAAFWPIGTAQIICTVSYQIRKKSRFWLFCMWSVILIACYSKFNSSTSHVNNCFASCLYVWFGFILPINNLSGVPENLLGQLSGFYLNPSENESSTSATFFHQTKQFQVTLLDIIDFSLNACSLNYMYVLHVHGRWSKQKMILWKEKTQNGSWTNKNWIKMAVSGVMPENQGKNTVFIMC